MVILFVDDMAPPCEVCYSNCGPRSVGTGNASVSVSLRASLRDLWYAFFIDASSQLNYFSIIVYLISSYGACVDYSMQCKERVLQTNRTYCGFPGTWTDI